MSKYLKVEVTRESGTELYIEVPDDFEPRLLMWSWPRYREQLATIADDTTDKFDWDDDGWEEAIEVRAINVVPEEKAKQYQIGRLDVLPQTTEGTNCADNLSNP